MNQKRETRAILDDAAIIEALSEAARQTAADDVGPGPTPAVWHRLQAARARLRDPGRGRLARWKGLRRGWLIAAAAATAVAVFTGTRLASRRQPLSYAVADQAAEQDGYIRGIKEGATEVRFSDGTRVDLIRGARLSVLSRSTRGARLRVEEGRARFDVVHREHAAWSVEAGPFVVLVTGTAFDVRWSGGDETIEVRLRQGSVQVGGPLLPERVTLRAGQRLVARLASNELKIDEGPGQGAGDADENAPKPASGGERPDVAPAPPPAAPPVPEAAPSVPPRITTRPPPRAAVARPAAAAPRETVWAPESWRARVAAGEAAAVVAEAETRDLDEVLSQVDGATLGALADAARYANRQDLAARVLLAQRRRFPGTTPAHTAAFLLGRLADDGGDTPAALDWYQRYLAEAPAGAFVSEALGRKMLTVERLGDGATAKSLAREYLRRFPNGTYLLQANSILAGP